MGKPPSGVDPNSDIAIWFRALVSPIGGSCCDQADGRVTDKVMVKNKEWQVWIDQRWGKTISPHWEPIPDRVILQNQHNPMGRWVVFYHHYIIWANGPNQAGTFHGEVRCAVPPTMS